MIDSFCKITVLGMSAIIASCVSVTVAKSPPEDDALQSQFKYVSVPENRDNGSQSRTIEAAFLRIAGRADGVPTFVFFGGPGESALDYGSISALKARHDYLLAYGDVIFIEQRGVGASRPNLDCGAVQLPLDAPVTAESILEGHRSLLKYCLEASGADMRGYTTKAIADDAEAIRKALGYDKVNVSGGSYGAQQAYYYTRYYGRHVNRAVLSQFLIPGTSLAMPSTIDDYIVQIGDRVGPAYGQEAGGGDTLLALIKSVFEKLEADPVDISVGDMMVRAGRTDVEIITSLALRRTREVWLLPMLFSQMDGGEFGFVGQVMMQFYRGGFPVNAAVLALDCADQTSTERQQHFANQAPVAVTGVGAHLPFPKVCESIDHGVVSTNSDWPRALQGVPTLIVQGELDPRARDENVQRVIEGQENVKLLVIGNVTHDLGRSVFEKIGPRINAIEAEFLFGDEWPAEQRIDVPLALN